SRDTAPLLHLFYLPGLKRLSMHMHLDPVADFPWPDASPPCAARLEYLSIIQPHELHLGPILSSTPNLQTLHWNRGCEPDSGPWPSVNLQHLSTALGQVKKTLKELRIRAYNPPTPGSRSLAAFQVPLHSLSLVEFDKITVLEVPITFVMGYPSRDIQMNHFPPNLQRLAITTDSSPNLGRRLLDIESPGIEPDVKIVYGNAMRRWLDADAKRETPHLKKVTFLMLVSQPPFASETSEEWRKLRKTITLIDIEIIYVNDDYYGPMVTTEPEKSGNRRGRCIPRFRQRRTYLPSR
ncbi:hypothetical protein QBC37DRAFT_301410, partial [Rhypophila decipiens]